VARGASASSGVAGRDGAGLKGMDRREEVPASQHHPFCTPHLLPATTTATPLNTCLFAFLSASCSLCNLYSLGCLYHLHAFAGLYSLYYRLPLLLRPLLG